jgi:hypothetical protein
MAAKARLMPNKRGAGTNFDGHALEAKNVQFSKSSGSIQSGARRSWVSSGCAIWSRHGYTAHGMARRILHSSNPQAKEV